MLWHRTCKHCSLPTMVQRDSAEKCPPGKEKGKRQISLPMAPHSWQRGSSQEQQQGEAGAPTTTQGRVPPLLGQRGQAGLWAPLPLLPLSQLSRDTAGPWGQSSRDISWALQRCSHHLPSPLFNVHPVPPGRGRSKQQQQPLQTVQGRPGSTPSLETASTRLGQPDSKTHTAQPRAIAACRDQQPQHRHSRSAGAAPGPGAGQQQQQQQQFHLPKADLEARPSRGSHRATDTQEPSSKTPQDGRCASPES